MLELDRHAQTHGRLAWSHSPPQSPSFLGKPSDSGDENGLESCDKPLDYNISLKNALRRLHFPLPT